MKQKTLFIGMFLLSLCLHAQFTIERHSGVPIEDGDVITFSEYAQTGGHQGELKFYVYNNSSAPIDMRIEFVSATNADGSLMQLCFGLCYTGITIGDSYPPNGGAVTIQPGKHQDSDGDHFINFDSGNGTQVIDYLFKFYQVDANGNEIGTPLFMTYRYDPNLGIADAEKIQVAVYPTLVKDKLTIETDENLEMKVYNLQGRLVKTTELEIGKQQIEMANLASQMYLVRFEDELGQIQTKKVIVQ